MPRSWPLSSAVILVASGCGLVSSEPPGIELIVPDKAFTIDATSWQVDDAKAAEYLMTSCADQPSVCSSAAAQACGTSCSGSCNADTDTCDLALDVSLYRPIDLVTEQPALRSTDDQLQITLDGVDYEVTANTLSIATPALEVFVAPSSVLEPGDPQARHLATISPIETKQITAGPRPLLLTPEGTVALTALMTDYDAPFNVIVGSQLWVRQNEPVPDGKIDAVIRIRARAGR
ncbi:MAG: hypothetical protein AB7P03_14920 [Kofleriaceae bacterium]